MLAHGVSLEHGIPEENHAIQRSFSNMSDIQKQNTVESTRLLKLESTDTQHIIEHVRALSKNKAELSAEESARRYMDFEQKQPPEDLDTGAKEKVDFKIKHGAPVTFATSERSIHSRPSDKELRALAPHQNQITFN